MNLQQLQITSLLLFPYTNKELLLLMFKYKHGTGKEENPENVFLLNQLYFYKITTMSKKYSWENSTSGRHLVEVEP